MIKFNPWYLFSGIVVLGAIIGITLGQSGAGVLIGVGAGFLIISLIRRFRWGLFIGPTIVGIGTSYGIGNYTVWSLAGVIIGLILISVYGFKKKTK